MTDDRDIREARVSVARDVARDRRHRPLLAC
jgi:hypothetical protein